MEQNTIYHVMAHAVAAGHCLPYTARSSDGSTPNSRIACGRAGGEWTENPVSDVTRPGGPGELCDAEGHRYDACGVCGGTATTTVDGKPALNAQSCDCAGRVLDSEGVCGGHGIDVCGVPGGPGIAVGKCDCDGHVQDCTGTVSRRPQASAPPDHPPTMHTHTRLHARTHAECTCVARSAGALLRLTRVAFAIP